MTKHCVMYKPEAFTKQGDKITIVGEAMWARLNPDFPPESNKYEISVKISKKDYDTLRKIKFANGGKLTGLKAVPVKDEDGDPTDETDYYQVTLKQNMFFKSKKTGEQEVFGIPVVTTKSKAQFTDMVGNGSVVRVIGKLWDNTNQQQGSKPQMGLNLAGVQIIELVEGAGGGSVFDDFEFEEGAEEAPVEKAKETKDDFDDDLPFDMDDEEEENVFGN